MYLQSTITIHINEFEGLFLRLCELQLRFIREMTAG